MSTDKAAEIHRRVAQALEPTSLDVLDEGHLHVGHAGEGQGHFRVRVTSAAFAGKSLMQRHRMVYEAVGDMMSGEVHALAIEARAPDEA